MGIRIRHVELVAMTASGPFGMSIGFQNGLTVVSAPNTSGKSTCAMGIIYALGLEGMLGPSHVPPFPAAMMDKLIYNGVQHEVISSQVRLEIENDIGSFATIQRKVLADPRDRQLIRVQLGRAITQPREYERRDFYVRTGGSATTDLGFHVFLAGFAGFDLPTVNGADGSRVPLYLECLFPYFFVEQISGWREIKSRMPTYLRIPEMAKRAFEFIMRFDVLLREVERQSLLQAEQALKTEWTNALLAAKAQFQGTGSMVKGISDFPEALWPPTPPPYLLVTDGKSWFTSGDFTAQILEELSRIRAAASPQAEVASDYILEELEDAEARLNEAQQQFDALASEIRVEHADIVAIDERLTVLREDLRKYQNTKRLETRGGVTPLKVAQGVCPTCDQPIRDALLSQDRRANPMSLEENMAFLRDQIETFQEMREESVSALAAKRKQLDTVRQQMANLSAIVREYKRMLRTDAEAPSAADIRKEMQLEDRLDGLQQAQEDLKGFLTIFAALAKRWTAIQSSLKEADSASLSKSDGAKLRYLEKLYLEQLIEYGFKSFPVNEMSLSNETYRPNVEGFELGLTSASDAIRGIWSYLLAMLEVARSYADTNHLGCVVFDEPKQQSTDDFSFAALLLRASKTKPAGQQVIFFTSEEQERLNDMLDGLDCIHVKFAGAMLTPINLPS